MLWIVECGVCQQPWEAAVPAYSMPGRSIVVPVHSYLDPKTNRRMAIPCSGIGQAAIGYGPKETWERDWRRRNFGRPLPEVFDGSGLKVVAL